MNRRIRIRIEPMDVRVALHPFLAGLNRTHLALLTDCAVSAEFDRSEIILREGEMAKQFYLLETGKVDLEAHSRAFEKVVIDTIGAGELLGWSCMFPPHVCRFTARAIEPTRAIIFCGEILRKYCERDHSLGYELLKRTVPVMLKRMQRAREKLVAVDAGTISLGPVLAEYPELAGNGTLKKLAELSYREGAD